MYSWKTLKEKLHIYSKSPLLKNYVTSFIPSVQIKDKTYFDEQFIDMLLQNQIDTIEFNPNHYPPIYPIQSDIYDFYHNYYQIDDFRTLFEETYHMNANLNSLSYIPGVSNKTIAKKFTLVDKVQYGIPKECMNELLEEYYNALLLKQEQDIFKYYELLSKHLKINYMNQTLELLKEFVLIKATDKKTITRFHNLRMCLVHNLNKELLNCNNDEIIMFIKTLEEQSIVKNLFTQFLNFLLENYQEKCSFDMKVKNNMIECQKSMDDFYSPKEWTNYVNFIFDIEHHIEKAFANYYYARYWLYCMLQCSLAWRQSDILNIPKLQIKNINQYSLSYFEQHPFTKAEAFQIINNAKLFIEQDPVHKTRTKKHFIIMNSFSIGTAIGMIICEQFRNVYQYDTLFGNIGFKSKRMVEQLGPQIKGFSNLKACRTILSFANEVNSNNENSSKAINISSYMRSHIVDERGLSNTTEIYLKSKYDDKELLSIPSRMNEIGLFGWLYKEILDCIDEKTGEHQIQVVRDEVTPMKLEGYTNFILNEQRNRKDVFQEVMTYDKEFLHKILEGKNISKVRDICCVKKSCPYPTSDRCEFCKYAIPTIHSIHLIGQETIELLTRLQKTETTPFDRNRYSYQLFKLLITLKEAKDELGLDFVNAFADYQLITEKVALLQKGENQ